MAKITVNGVTFSVPDGSSVQVTDNSIIVGGKVIQSGLSGTVHVEWKGPVGDLNCTSCTIHGDVNGDVDGTSIRCGNVMGNVDGTQITCGDVKGSVDGVQVSRK